MVKRLAGSTLTAAGVVFGLCATSCAKKIDAKCGGSYISLTEADCKSIADKARCESHELVAHVMQFGAGIGPVGSCEFKDCDETPDCGEFLMLEIE
jgi:hypothetical protein